MADDNGTISGVSVGRATKPIGGESVQTPQAPQQSQKGGGGQQQPQAQDATGGGGCAGGGGC